MVKLFDVPFLIWLIVTSACWRLPLDFKYSPSIVPQNKEIRYSLKLTRVQLKNVTAGESLSDLSFKRRLVITFKLDCFSFRHYYRPFRKKKG